MLLRKGILIKTSLLLIVVAGGLVLLAQTSGSSKTEAAAPAPIFTDVSAAAGLRTNDLESFGLQWADYDNDGWLDFYVGRHGGCDPDLFHSNGNGTFENVSLTSGIRVCGGDRHNCTWADMNADGLIDLFCTVGDGGIDSVLTNQGNGTFVDNGPALGFGLDSGRAASIMDFDGDADLDILYGAHHDLHLLQNDGSSFTLNTTLTSTGNQGPRSQSTADYNMDGIPDAFVAMFPHSTFLLLQGTGSGFVDATAQAGITQTGAQSGTWGDYDNDGDLDLFIADFRRSCCSNPFKLMENKGNGTFQNVTAATGLVSGAARVGVWGDYNNDGWLDLFVVNGTTNNDGVNRPDQLWINQGNKTFSLAGTSSGLSGPTTGSGDSAAWGDYDRDGDLDILVGNGSGELECQVGYVPYCLGPDKLYRNQGNSNFSFQLRVMSDDDPYGFGTKVWLETPSGTQYREMTDNMVGKSQLPPNLHFGLGSQNHVDELRIRWPDGSEETYSNLAANTSPTFIHQGSGQVPSPTPVPTPSPKPDLIVTSIKEPPSSIARGQSFDGANTTKNVGTSGAAASHDQYYLSRDRVWSSDDIPLVGIRNVPALAPNAQFWSTVTITVPTSVTPRRYYIFACADDDKLISELIESNNCKPSVGRVNVT